MLRTAIMSLAVVGAIVAQTQPAAATLPNGFAEEIMGTGMQFPVGFAILPGERALVVEQYSSKIQLVDNSIVSTVAVVPNVAILGERGLQGIAIDPEWPDRPYVYVHYTAASPPSVKVSRFTASGDLEGGGFEPLAIDTASRYDILAGLQDNTHVHQGGTIRFGKDKMMYVSLGEDNNACLAQDLTALEGSILRLDVSNLPPGPGGPPLRADLIASGNPFQNAADENTRLVWVYGLRNPFRFALDSKTGDIFVADVGGVTYEEINYSKFGGENFGWPWLEGTTPIASCVVPGVYEDPLFGYDHSLTGSSSIIAGVVYHKDGNQPNAFPQGYEGDFFYSDYYTGELTRMTLTQGQWQIAAPVSGQPSATVWATGLAGATDYALGPEGGIWYSAHQYGQLRRILFFHGAVDVPIVNRPAVPTPLYFDIQGRRVDRPGASGIYFVRDGKSGKTKRVILK